MTFTKCEFAFVNQTLTFTAKDRVVPQKKTYCLSKEDSATVCIFYYLCHF